MDCHQVSYVLPLRSERPVADHELTSYLRHLATIAEVIVVDGSSATVFDLHHTAWNFVAAHVPPDPARVTPMGKVGGVLTGIALASHEAVIIADDDVRYDDATLLQVVAALRDADVVRPQNYFTAMPWHAWWDTGRTLLNRVSGGDWPGTLGVRRSVLERTNGYDGRAMFENLELVRTVIAAGGRERVLLDAYVARHPSTAPHFWSQRVRQAYDELARPARLAWQLALLPLIVTVGMYAGIVGEIALAAVTVVVAETGRRRAGGTRIFPFVASLAAPFWIAERAACSWLAVGSRVLLGGVRYRGRTLRHAATTMRELRERHAHLAVRASDHAPVASPISDVPSSGSSSISIGLNVPLLDSSAEHAVTPTIRSISARSTT